MINSKLAKRWMESGDKYETLRRAGMAVPDIAGRDCVTQVYVRDALEFVRNLSTEDRKMLTGEPAPLPEVRVKDQPEPVSKAKIKPVPYQGREKAVFLAQQELQREIAQARSEWHTAPLYKGDDWYGQNTRRSPWRASGGIPLTCQSDGR